MSEFNLYGDVEAMEAKDALDHKQMLLDFSNTFQTASGQRVFWHILSWCHYLASVWDKSGMDIHYKAAQLDVAHRLMDVVSEADPLLLAEILTMGLKQRAEQMKLEVETKEIL